VGIYKSLTVTWMWKVGLWPHNSFSGNICFEFSVLCLCSVRRYKVLGSIYVLVITSLPCCCSVVLLCGLPRKENIFCLGNIYWLLWYHCWHSFPEIRFISYMYSQNSGAATRRWILVRLHNKAVHHITTHSLTEHVSEWCCSLFVAYINSYFNHFGNMPCMFLS
jgi:hypothetical protein